MFPIAFINVSGGSRYIDFGVIEGIALISNLKINMWNQHHALKSIEVNVSGGSRYIDERCSSLGCSSMVEVHTSLLLKCEAGIVLHSGRDCQQLPPENWQ